MAASPVNQGRSPPLCNREEYVVERKELLNSAARTLDEIASKMSRGGSSLKVIEKQDKDLDELKVLWKEYFKNRKETNGNNTTNGNGNGINSAQVSSSHLGSSLSNAFHVDL
eukprot:CAMPEP_0202442670 /NCGR_PEP_ID=MMETSP1360-20130828/2057_1 /ASSEMBLY_ACC=CAM_ASM_000848 /TAXON_ID=515479 /ORGANISM="Licmophora paradoxa, Strain CCMP2313" /LENGTH=111 /DNA_ID=CAMNT_0049058101 /DNA_START=38 /DNA_END=373 /DNA_ORIENTATION=-